MTDSLPKQKVSLSLDADVVAELEKRGPLSPQVNDALHAESNDVGRRLRYSVWSWSSPRSTARSTPPRTARPSGGTPRMLS